MNTLRFGTAGIPHSTVKPSTPTGIKRVRELGLDAMEMEFVRSIHLKPAKAPEVKKAAQENDVTLTCHGPYFINLNSTDMAIRKSSMQRILDSARVMALAGGWSVCFHAAYYSGVEQQQVYETVKHQLKQIVSQLKDEGHTIWIRPETGGKINQFAESKKLIKLATEVDMVLPCFDFAHEYSRTLGKWNTTEEFRSVLSECEKKLGKEGLHNIHAHTEGIAFTDRGEKNHLNLNECDFKYHDLIKVWKEFDIKGVIICESPNIEEDALLLQKIYNK